METRSADRDTTGALHQSPRTANASRYTLVKLKNSSCWGFAVEVDG